MKKNYEQKEAVEIEGKGFVNAERKNSSSRKRTTKKRNNNPQGSKNRGKFNDDDFKYRSNHPQWYFKDKNTLDAVASFSYATPLGSDLLVSEVYDTGANESMSAMSASVPGLMAMYIGLTPGIADNAQDPVNLAAQNVYSFVRYKNSGAKNYDAPDLMMYLLTMDSIYACWSWLRRIYGYTSAYAQTNRYRPRAYAAADHVDLDDIYAHLADFRAYINMTADRISAFCVPATMTYNVRHSWLFSNIFKDEDTWKAQEYIYCPSWFYKYDETSSPKGGQLEAIDVNYSFTKKWTFQSLISLMDSLINSAMYSEDIGVMSGDILKAYEAGNLFKLSAIEPDYRIAPTHDKAALSQIENANIWYSYLYSNANAIFPLTAFTISQDPDTNYIKFRPTNSSETTVYYDIPIGNYLNFHWDNPSSEDVIEATRLMWSGEIAGDNKAMTFTSLGSEFVTDVHIFTFMQSQDWEKAYVRYAPMQLVDMPIRNASEAAFGFVDGWRPYLHSYGNDIAQRCVQTLTLIFNWLAFDWAPAIKVGVAQADGETDVIDLPYIRDWSNYTVLGYSNVVALNTLAILSEFNVPN